MKKILILTVLLASGSVSAVESCFGLMTCSTNCGTSQVKCTVYTDIDETCFVNILPNGISCCIRKADGTEKCQEVLCPTCDSGGGSDDDDDSDTGSGCDQTVAGWWAQCDPFAV